MIGSLPVLDTASDGAARRRATLAYIAPFLVLVGLMAMQAAIHLPAHWYYPVQFLAVLSTIGFVSRPVLSFRAAFPLASIGIGIAVFLIWIGPDLFDTAARQRILVLALAYK